MADRAALVARVRGRGHEKPILVTAHMDVVGVEPDQWSVPPFGGEVRDGYVYGRGAIDDKGMLVAELMALLLAQREARKGKPPERDIIFLASADEEAGGDYGLHWVLEHHADLIQAEYAINEGGRIRVVEGRPLYAAVQCAEKAPHVVAVVATGPGGHASIALTGNAVSRLARAVAMIAADRPQVTLTPVTRAFFDGLSRVWPDSDEAAAMADVSSDDAERIRRGSERLAKAPLFDALLRASVSPTMLLAGIRHNVIPAEARATINVRTLPGESIDALLTRWRALVADPQIEITANPHGPAAPASTHESDAFRSIAGAIHELDESIAVLPYMSPGATESAVLRAAGIPTYGLLPFPLGEDDERRMHGADERIPIAAFEFGIRLLHSVTYRTDKIAEARRSTKSALNLHG